MPTDERFIVVTFKAPPSLVGYLEHVARQKGIPKSELIRRAVSYYLKYNLDAKPVVTRRITIW